MTDDPRIEAGARALQDRLLKPVQVLSVVAQYEMAETVLAAADAADSAAGVVRVDLNDENLLYRLAEAIEQPIQYLGYVGDNAYLELPQEQVQLYAIRHALRQPEQPSVADINTQIRNQLQQDQPWPRRALQTLTELERIPLEQRTEAEVRFIYRWRTWLEIHPEYDLEPRRLSDVRWPGNPPGGET